MTRASLKTRSSGFTLIEVKVAISVLLILSVVLCSMLTESAQTWQQAEARITSRQSGRAILDSMSRDLVGATLPRDRTSQTDLQFVINPSTITTATFLSPCAIFWQAPVATDTTYGTLAEVGYFVRWDTSNASNPKAMLCRFLVNPENPTSIQDYLIHSTPTAWLSDSLLNTVAPGVQNLTTPSNSFKGWLADNVIGLWIRPLYWDPTSKTWQPIIQYGSAAHKYTNYAYDSRLAYSYTSGTTTELKCGYTNPATSSDQILATLPDSLEIALVILNTNAAARLKTIPTYSVTNPPTAASFWSDINNFVASLPASIRPGAQIYSTIVQLNHST